MATLTTVRADLRLDLNDPSGASERFADGDLDRAVERALLEFSQVWPYVQESTLSTVADSRDISLASLSGLWDVEAVEWATGEYPRKWRRFEVSPDKQTLALLVTSAPSAVENALVRWASIQTINGLNGAVATTVPEDQEELLLLGAYGFAWSK